MSDASEKVAFASPAWVDIARVVLEDLVAKHGEIGKSFSACEVFTDAPQGVAGADSKTAAWHFRIVDKTVTVGEGEITGADFNVSADYQSAVPAARIVYTPEMVARMQQNPPQVEAESTGERPNLPPYLLELHNRMAVVTQ